MFSATNVLNNNRSNTFDDKHIRRQTHSTTDTFDDKYIRRQTHSTTDAFAISFSHAEFNINEVFRNDNRRHVYNIDDYVYFVVINKTFKNQLVQFFFHMYRDNIYDFFVVFAIQNLKKIDDSDVMNLVLKLFVRRRRIIQIIHEIHALSQKKLYFIETKNEKN